MDRPNRQKQLKIGIILLCLAPIAALIGYWCPNFHTPDPQFPQFPDFYWSSLDWPITSGVITKCETKSRKSHLPWENAEYGQISYVYKVGQKQYSSSNVRSGYLIRPIGSGKSPYKPDFDRSSSYIQAHYPIGMVVKVHCDLNRPDYAYLEAAMSDAAILYRDSSIGLGILLLIAGIWTIFFDRKQ